MKKITLLSAGLFLAMASFAQNKIAVNAKPKTTTITVNSNFDGTLTAFNNAKNANAEKAAAYRDVKAKYEAASGVEKAGLKKQMDLAKGQLDKSVAEVNANKKAVLDIATKEDATAQTNVKTTQAKVDAAQKVADEKDAQVTSLQDRIAAAAGVEKANLVKELALAKGQKDKAMSDLNANKALLDNVNATAVKMAANLATAKALQSVEPETN
jgi:beta-mannanase